MNTLEGFNHAIKTKNITEIVKLLDIDLQPHEKDKYGNTVLHRVLKNGELMEPTITEILGIFLAGGVDLNSENDHRETVLHLAVARRMKDVIDLLIKHNATINTNNRSYVTHDFIKDEFVKFWKLRNDSKREKMENESANFVEYLISKGFDFHRRCESGRSAMQLAEASYLLHIIPPILKHNGNVKSFIQEGKILFCGCILENGWTKLNFLTKMEKSWYRDYKLRHVTSIVKILLDKLDPTDEKRRELLDLILSTVEPKIIEMAVNHFPDGCDERSLATTTFYQILSHRDNYSILNTQWYLNILTDLISRGADVNYKNEFGRSPLYWAILKKNLQMVEFLKAKGANFNVVNKYGNTLLHMLAWKVHEETNGIDNDEILFDLLITEGCRVNARCERGRTPLHEAARNENLTIVRKLVDRGASINCRSDDLRTPLHLAVVNPKLPDVAKFLIDKGADVNSRDSTGRTPLHLASISRHSNVVVLRLLLDRGAHVDVRDNNGSSALAETVVMNNIPNAKMLLEHGANSKSPCVMKNFRLVLNIFGSTGVVDLLSRHRFKLNAAQLAYDDVLYNVQGDPARFHKECLQEVKVLKRTFIDNRTSLYQLLHMDLNGRCIHINNEKLKNIVDSPKIEEKFPKYSTIILASYSEAEVRKSLLEPAKEAWLTLTQISLPDICVERIVSYLSNDEYVDINLKFYKDII